MSALSEALTAVNRLLDRARSAPLDYISWLPYQIDWLSHFAPEPCLLRTGNRMGKSTGGGGELIFRCRGVHPFKAVPESPVRVALVTYSSTQGIEIQRVLWDLLGGRNNTELVDTIEFSSRTGFRGHRPIVEFKNGSEIHIFANAQGAGALSGAEYSYILLDEPPDPTVYDECKARVRNTGGRIGLTLTPINGPPLPWLQALCESGTVRDIHVRLTPESQISPLTGQVRRTRLGIPWDADFIAEIRRLENPIDAPIRIDGEWESRTEGQFFRCFDPELHVSRHLPDQELKWALGIDYAAADRELGMCAVLSGIDMVKEDDGRTHPYIYALAEIIVPGNTTAEVFAQRILRELQDCGLKWSDLDFVYGDNPVKSRWVQSSNRELGRCVSRQLRVDQNYLRPRVLSAKEGGGRSGRNRRSKDVRCRWTYGAIAADRVRVHPRCKTLVKALQQWDYGDQHEYKDVLDGWMYGLRDYWGDADRKGTAPLVVFR